MIFYTCTSTPNLPSLKTKNLNLPFEKSINRCLTHEPVTKQTHTSITETSQTMKSTLLTFSLLLFSFTYFPLAFTDELIEDINGNLVFPTGKYYIAPLMSKGGGGGLKLGKTGNSDCPVTVLQEFSEVVRGFPVRFIIRSGIKPGFIRTTDALDIEFVKKPKCAESAKWVLAQDDFPTSWVGIGDNIDAFQGSFKIEKLGSGYKLVYCPLFSAPPGACSDIGRYRDENGWRLVPTENDPFVVVFVDASESEKAVV